MKISLLIVNKNSNSLNLNYYNKYTQAGNAVSLIFTSNFGIDTNTYGTEALGYCLQGLYYIDLYVYPSSL